MAARERRPAPTFHLAASNEPVRPAPSAGPTLSREDADRLFQEYARTRSIELRNELVERYRWLVPCLVQRYAGSAGHAAASREDLIQVGCVGLIQAVERYDPERGVSFSAFAGPTILGVIKHYLRDHTWSIKAPRRLRELGQSLRARGAELEQRQGRPPTVAELARAAGVDEERVLLAMDLDRHYESLSLDAVVEGREGNAVEAYGAGHGSPDPRLVTLEAREALRAALERLDERQRLIIRARFFEEQTQAEVAERLGISQMHVSRLERQALRVLRAVLADRP